MRGKRKILERLSRKDLQYLSMCQDTGCRDFEGEESVKAMYRILEPGW